MTAIISTAEQIAALSAWIDAAPLNASKASTEQLWARCAKVGEEFGEVISEVVSFTGQNPRKPQGSSTGQIIKELLDVALTALAAVEHLTDNAATSLDWLEDHVQFVFERAGLAA